MAGRYNRKDHLYNKAKSEGYRSRATFKLEEIDASFGILKPGFKVIDLGAWPGGWLQFASKRVGASGLVVGIDLVEIEELGLSNVKTVTGDVRDLEEILSNLKLLDTKFDLVLSDMSPKLSGIKEVDRFGSVACAELALWAATKVLKSGGNLVIKVFKSSETDAFVKSFRPMFNKVVRSELDATRKTSNEYYLVGFGFKSSEA